MTVIPFAPSPTQTPPFQVTVTLDTVPYNLTAMWNFAAQRWYASLVSASGTVAWYGALVGSPLDYDIPLAPGIFTTSKIIYREDSGNFEITP
ncbi:phage baseplate plug family protein [Paraburkholderia caffeinilytica]|uniref:phage baseplate plug family protein n=1 Tax=Paraburkholderia caffeinilytica TaxID=1761016 RepID=UPI0038BC431E